MNRNQVKGHIKTATGKSKEIVGEATGDRKLKYRGKAQKARGRIETAYGDVKDDLEKSGE